MVKQEVDKNADADNTVRRTRGPAASKARELEQKQAVSDILSAPSGEAVLPTLAKEELNVTQCQNETPVSTQERRRVMKDEVHTEEDFEPTDTFFNTWCDTQRVSVKESLMQASPVFKYDREVFRTPDVESTSPRIPSPPPHRSPLIPPVGPDDSESDGAIIPTRRFCTGVYMEKRPTLQYIIQAMW